MKWIKCIAFSGLLFFLGSKILNGQHQKEDDHAGANKHMHSSSFDDLIIRFESPERNEWQKPDEVLKHMGNLRNKTVMDIGSGTGYFSFRLVEAGAKVICGDVDDRFLEYIVQKKKEKNLSDDQMIVRKLPYESPLLTDGEVDMVLIVNTYHHIENRDQYFSAVKKGLKKNGKLVIIDFLKEDTPVGPPVKMKLSAQEVVGELVKSGFTNFDINIDLLPYQYIIIAK